jgi:CRISPR-associated exonuclease Cas4
MIDPPPRSTSAEDDDFLPLSALNDFLFCARRCALHRVEGVWTENVHTVEGSQAHRRVHAPGKHQSDESPFREVRGLRLRSDRLRLIGVADLVEFRPQPYPVEYKRGKRRRWDNDEVQLCAQALCLEEMLGGRIAAGAIFHVKSKRRREVVLDDDLRQLTVETARRLHELVASGRIPPPVPMPKCRQCSLRPLCMPELVADTRAYQRAATELFRVAEE